MSLTKLPLLVFVLVGTLLLSAKSEGENRADESSAQPSEQLPSGTAGFHGKIIGKVVSVDRTKCAVVIVVEKVVPDEAKNKAANPQALVAQTITVQAATTKSGEGKKAKAVPKPDEAAFLVRMNVGGDAVLDVMVSRKSTQFRLTRVPPPDK